jgi:succinate-semialdehyde dehydrogenase/glutarate-semialdehyde dehydrogenase
MNDKQMLATRNPRTGETDHDMPVFDAEQVAAVAQALRQAQPAWAALPLADRLARLAQLADAMTADTAALAAAIAADTGRHNESVMEVQGTVGTIRRWLDDAPGLLAEETPYRSRVAHITVEPQRRPYGVAGIISPWNFPLILSMIDAVPALVAGCAVIVKPSEATPRFVAVLERIIARVEGLASVLRFVTGAGPTGEALVRHSDVVCFTGSVRTGRRVGLLAAEVFVPVHLELGGKDAAIVCADADIARAARALAWGSMGAAGQSCMSIERCYVQRSVYDDFVAALVAEVAGLQHCWPDISAGQIGPIISAVQVPIVQRHLTDALAQGARALTGGQVVQQGRRRLVRTHGVGGRHARDGGDDGRDLRRRPAGDALRRRGPGRGLGQWHRLRPVGLRVFAGPRSRARHRRAPGGRRHLDQRRGADGDGLRRAQAVLQALGPGRLAHGQTQPAALLSAAGLPRQRRHAIALVVRPRRHASTGLKTCLHNVAALLVSDMCS